MRRTVKRRYLATGILLVGCTAPEDGGPELTDGPTPTIGTAWPAWELRAPLLESTEWWRGRTATVVVIGTPAGAQVTLYQSRVGDGPGPCLADDPSVCLRILDPDEIGTYTADIDGRVSVQLDIDPDEPPDAVYLQALVFDAERGSWTTTPDELRHVGVPVPEAAVQLSLRDVGMSETFTGGNTHTGGVAWLDYNGDFWPDVFISNGAAEPFYLYRNNGDGTFSPNHMAIQKPPGFVEAAGARFGDIDNDGDDDLLVVGDTPHLMNGHLPNPYCGFGMGCGPNMLYINNGDGTFSDVTARAGVGDPEWGSSCAFVDYDRDGLLDIFVVNYLVFDPTAVKRRGTDPTCQYKGQQILCGPIGLPPAPCTLYRNRGDGTFEDVSEASRIRAVKPSYGLGVTVIHHDADDWPDLYVANDTRANLLFRNLGNGRFEEVGELTGVAYNDNAVAQAGMGADAPFLRPGAPEDLMVTNYEDDTNTFYRNDGAFFTEVTSPIGLAQPSFKFLGWGVFFFDPDLDADLDVFVAQGHVVPQADDMPSSPGYLQPNRLFLNDGTGKFVDATSKGGAGLAVKKSSRGAAFGDLDGDGDPDVVVAEIDTAATLLENAGTPHTHWLAVRLRGTTSNRDGIGAIVSVTANGRTQRWRVRSGSSYASQSELLARFGLGAATRADEIRVRWTTGKEEEYPPPNVDQVILLVEGEGTPHTPERGPQ